MTYPLKFRQHVLATRAKENLSFAQTAQRFNVGIASLMRWAKKPEPVMKRQKPATKVNMTALDEDVRLYPDAYLRERAARLGVSASGIRWALARLGVTRKKRQPGTRRQILLRGNSFSNS